jgi:hypothetical protein
MSSLVAALSPSVTPRWPQMCAHREVGLPPTPIFLHGVAPEAVIVQLTERASGPLGLPLTSRVFPLRGGLHHPAGNLPGSLQTDRGVAYEISSTLASERV